MFEQAVSKRSSDSFNCWFHLGLMYFRTQMYSKAKESFQRSLEALRSQAVLHPNKIDPTRLSALEARALSLVAQCSIYELTAPGVIPSGTCRSGAVSDQSRRS